MKLLQQGDSRPSALHKAVYGGSPPSSAITLTISPQRTNADAGFSARYTGTQRTPQGDQARHEEDRREAVLAAHWSSGSI